MKKTFRLEGLDCAHCAAKIEKKVATLKGVESVSVNFLTAKMNLELGDDTDDSLIAEIEKVVKKFEPDVEMKRI